MQIILVSYFSSIPAGRTPSVFCCDFFRMLITFANILDTDQDRQIVSPDQESKMFDNLEESLKYFFRLILKKKQQTSKA